MADPDTPSETSPATTEGKTGLQGGYGSDTGFASDEAKSGQVDDDGSARGQIKDSGDGDDLSADDVPDDLDGDPDENGPGAVSATDLRAGSPTGGSASGAEAPSNPDDALRRERSQSVPNGKTASMVAADVTEDIGGVLGDDSPSGGSPQSGGTSTQPGTGVKRSAPTFSEDGGHMDRGESHGGRGDPIENTGHPNVQQQKSAF